MNKIRFIDKIVFLVGGKGTRLGGEYKNTPKSLIKIGERTLLDFSVAEVGEIGFSEAIFVAGFHGQKIADHVNKYAFPKRVIIQGEDEIRGTAYALWDARRLIEPNNSFLLVLPDSIWKFKNLDFLKEKDENTIFCMKTENAHLFGQVALDGDNFITAIGLKENPPKSLLVDIGVYYFSEAKHIFNRLEEEFKNIDASRVSREIYLTTLMGDMIKDGHKFKMRELEYWYDCGTLGGLNEARRILENNPNFFQN